MKVTWSKRAIRNANEIHEYIAKDSEQNAAQVAERLLRAVELLNTHPEIGRPGRVFGTRELVVPGTPCVIPYWIRHGRLQLIAVLHGRQKWPMKF
jgi:toxin ParE1/3/4